LAAHFHLILLNGHDPVYLFCYHYLDADTCLGVGDAPEDFPHLAADEGAAVDFDAHCFAVAGGVVDFLDEAVDVVDHPSVAVDGAGLHDVAAAGLHDAGVGQYYAVV